MESEREREKLFTSSREGFVTTQAKLLMCCFSRRLLDLRRALVPEGDTLKTRDLRARRPLSCSAQATSAPSKLTFAPLELGPAFAGAQVSPGEHLGAKTHGPALCAGLPR